MAPTVGTNGNNVQSAGLSTAESMGTNLTYVGIKRRMRKLKVQNKQRKVKMAREKGRKRKKRRKMQKELLN